MVGGGGGRGSTAIIIQDNAFSETLTFGTIRSSSVRIYIMLPQHYIMHLDILIALFAEQSSYTGLR